MATMKRRVIYASDEDWAVWRTEAQATNRTISEFIRAHLAGYLVVARQQSDRYDQQPVRAVPKVKR